MNEGLLLGAAEAALNVALWVMFDRKRISFGGELCNDYRPPWS
jgi:hypothetical protein